MFKLYHDLLARFYSRKLRRLDYPTSRKYQILAEDTEYYNSIVTIWSYHHHLSR